MNVVLLIFGITTILFVILKMYLEFTDQHTSIMFQRHDIHKRFAFSRARCWWTIYPNRDENWKKIPFSIWVEWSLFDRHASPAASYSFHGEDFNIMLYFSFWFIGSIWFHVKEDRMTRWMRSHLHPTNYGYQTGFETYKGTVALKFIYSEMWGSGPDIKVKWLPRWIHIWRDSSYSNYDMHGLRCSADFDYAFWGSYERDEEFIQVITHIDIPIEPDNSYGLSYYGTWTEKVEIRWRGNFPQMKKRNHLWEISSNAPPMRAGKGENSWDLDDDGTFGTAFNVETLPEAITEYMRRCYHDRIKYGMPGWWHKEKERNENNV